MTDRKFILAGNHRQAVDYACEQGWGIRGWVYIHDDRDIHGLYEPTIHVVGTWNQRKDIELLTEELRACRAKNQHGNVF